MKFSKLGLVLIFSLLFTIIVGFVFEKFVLRGETSFADWWVSWKLEHPANKQQREIVCYFKKTHEFLGVAEGTQQQTPDSSWGLRDINAALKIVQKSLDVSRNLVVPSLCENYHVLVIATLQYIKKYHETRVLLDENKIEESALREVRLEQLKLAAKQSKEFYKIIREAGFIRFW